jgi:ion channel
VGILVTATATQDRKSLFLLLALLLFLLLVPFLENSRLGEFVLVVSTYGTLVAAAVQLSEREALIRPSILLAGLSMLANLGSHFVPIRPLIIANFILLTAFFGFVAVGLFAYLGKPGSITTGRIYASASLYLILGMFWYGLYNLIDTVAPGSFAHMRAAAAGGIPRGSLLYFSFITLTTTGYGDVLPVSPVAQMAAALEAVTGVLYIAITVARLVASYQKSAGER